MTETAQTNLCTEKGRQVQGRENNEENDSNKNSENTPQGELKKDVSCQVDSYETSGVYQAIKDEFELEKAKMQNSSIKERTQREMSLREEYHEIVKEKNTLIQVLTDEKDFIWNELENLRVSYDILARRLENSHDPQQGRHDDSCYCCHDTCELNDDVEAALSLQKEEFMRVLEEERMQQFRRCEREKIMLTELVAKECDAKYARERTYLLESIDGLKEGLTSLTKQKDELARIFEGEKNAMELSFARKEKELKEQLKLQVQKKLVHAHASWSKTQV